MSGVGGGDKDPVAAIGSQDRGCRGNGGLADASFAGYQDDPHERQLISRSEACPCVLASFVDQLESRRAAAWSQPFLINPLKGRMNNQ